MVLHVIKILPVQIHVHEWCEKKHMFISLQKFSHLTFKKLNILTFLDSLTTTFQNCIKKKQNKKFLQVLVHLPVDCMSILDCMMIWTKIMMCKFFQNPAYYSVIKQHHWCAYLDWRYSKNAASFKPTVWSWKRG